MNEHATSSTVHQEPTRRVRYEFLLAEQVSETVRASFPELTTRPGPAGGTLMYGAVEDTAHLHGLLDHFWTLGLCVLEMRQLPD